MKLYNNILALTPKASFGKKLKHLPSFSTSSVDLKGLFNDLRESLAILEAPGYSLQTYAPHGPAHACMWKPRLHLYGLVKLLQHSLGKATRACSTSASQAHTLRTKSLLPGHYKLGLRSKRGEIQIEHLFLRLIGSHMTQKEKHL